jgi:lipopolysaccharide transport system permease protein
MQSEVEVQRERRRLTPEAVPADALEGQAVTTIRPRSGWGLVNVRELWQFRELVFFLTWRDVMVRYKQTVLGVAWAVLQPVMMVVIFTLFFHKVGGVAADDGLPYYLFAYAGILPWMLFSTGITGAGNSVVGSERLITKIYFPRLAVPFAAAGAPLLDFLIGFGVLAALMAWNWQRITLGPALLLVPVVVACIFLAALGVGTLLAALTVAYRDFRHVTPFLVQLWMFATPTIYMAVSKNVGPRLGLLLAVNPMASLVGTFRSAILGGDIHWPSFALAAAGCVALFVAGCLYFRKVEDTFADII